MICLIRLIASDIDGTLLPYGQNELPASLFKTISRLLGEGIMFCAASGRQYHSLRKLFAPIADEICFLCENGAAVFGPGSEESAPLLSETAFSRKDAMDVISDILSFPGCSPLISSPGMSYLCSPDAGYYNLMADQKSYLITCIDDPEEIEDDIVKISAYCPVDLSEAESKLAPLWRDRFNVAVAGREWLDFTIADKGNGLRELCRALQIDRTHVASVGDNWNDLPMLEYSGEPWIMSDSDPALLRLIPNHCSDVSRLLLSFING